MPYLIDGYNLLFAIGRLTPRSGRPALENARKELLRSLGLAADRHADLVTVVFDTSAGRAPKGPAPAPARVEALFAVGQTADDLIEALIARETAPKRLTVVSDDHRLKDAARRRGCPSLGCLDFHERFLQPRSEAPPAPAVSEPEKPAPGDTAHWLGVFGPIDDDPNLGGPF